MHKCRNLFYSIIYRWISNSLINKEMIIMIKIPLQEKIGSCYFAPISTQFPRRRLLKATFSFVITQTLHVTLFLCCQEITKLKIEKGVQWKWGRKLFFSAQAGMCDSTCVYEVIRLQLLSFLSITSQLTAKHIHHTIHQVASAQVGQ